jgi:hypothetical protein
MRTLLPTLLTLFVCATPLRAEETGSTPFTRDYVSEVIRHMYRWHLDETALHTVSQYTDVEIWVRPVKMALDEGDHSRYYELVAPRLLIRLLLKKADYELPELKLRVQNADFRILRVERLEELPSASDGFEILHFDRKEILDRLFKTRDQRSYPDDALRERLRVALRAHLGESAPSKDAGPQTLYVGPLSPVSNDLWCFWENEGKIIRFSSDADFTSEAYWALEKIGVRVYDLDKNVVVSMDEVAGSNAFVTRDWAARVLFNCVVFGQRLTVIPQADLNIPAQIQESPRPAK